MYDNDFQNILKHNPYNRITHIIYLLSIVYNQFFLFENVFIYKRQSIVSKY